MVIAESRVGVSEGGETGRRVGKNVCAGCCGPGLSVDGIHLTFVSPVIANLIKKLLATPTSYLAKELNEH